LAASTFILSSSVVGLNGFGKSTVSHILFDEIPQPNPSCQFINTAAGRTVARVGHGLLPCTADIQIIPVSHPRIEHRRIIFIDTPGFDQPRPHISDRKILESIIKTLREM
jgi:hypothetical protein